MLLLHWHNGDADNVKIRLLNQLNCYWSFSISSTQLQQHTNNDKIVFPIVSIRKIRKVTVYGQS